MADAETVAPRKVRTRDEFIAAVEARAPALRALHAELLDRLSLPSTTEARIRCVFDGSEALDPNYHVYIGAKEGDLQPPDSHVLRVAAGGRVYVVWDARWPLSEPALRESMRRAFASLVRNRTNANGSAFEISETGAFEIERRLREAARCLSVVSA